LGFIPSLKKPRSRDRLLVPVHPTKVGLRGGSLWRSVEASPAGRRQRRLPTDATSAVRRRLRFVGQVGSSGSIIIPPQVAAARLLSGPSFENDRIRRADDPM